MTAISSYPETVGWPQPTVTQLNRPFWEAANRAELMMQQCEACEHLRFPIAPTCPECLSNDSRWTAVSGHGVVFARAVYRRAFGDRFADALPYSVAIIQLDEGPRMISNIVGADPEIVDVGDQVEVVFDRPTISDDQPLRYAVPRFRPLQNSHSAIDSGLR